MSLKIRCWGLINNRPALIKKRTSRVVSLPWYRLIDIVLDLSYGR